MTGLNESLLCNATGCALGPATDADNATFLRPPLMKLSASVAALFAIAYGIVFTFGVVNNSLVVSVIYRNRQMRTVTNYFIANLAVADILVSFIVLPFTLMNTVLSEWLVGEFLCKSVGYLQAVTVGASVNTLAAVAVERYLAIFYPHLTLITTSRALAIIAVIWLIPACIQLPWAIYNTVQFLPGVAHHFYICCPDVARQFLRNFILGGVFLTCYMIPLCFLAVFYTLIGLRVWRRNVAGIRGSQAERNIVRSKKRIVRMLIVVTVFFTFSWLPLYVTHLRIMFGPPMDVPTQRVIQSIVQPITQWFGSANSCVNPFIYCYFSKHFRRGILAVLRSRSCCDRVDMTSAASRTGTANRTPKHTVDNNTV